MPLRLLTASLVRSRKLFKHLFQLRFREPSSAQHHSKAPRRVAHILERVLVEQDHVGGLSFCNYSELIRAHELGGVCGGGPQRAEEHTSELQSLAYLVCRLLLEKK